MLLTYINYHLTEDGVNVSQWLQSLETFTGEFYKRRPFVEFRGILSYLMRRLQDGNVMELGMLRTLLKTAGGYSFADYSPAASLNETQLDGRAGSLTLKRETMSFGIVEQTSSRAADRIRDVLQKEGLGVSMLILIAQARDRLLFDSTRGAFKEVKLVGNLYDSCQVVMSILLEFLTSEEVKQRNGSTPATSDMALVMYSKYLPTLQKIHGEFGLDFETAWCLCRPAVKAALGNIDAEGKTHLERFELTEDVRKSYSDCIPETVWDSLTPTLLEFFHKNSLADIFCPEGIYATETNRVDKEIDRIQSVRPPPPKPEMEGMERLKFVSKQLGSDLKQQKEHVESVLKDFDEEKSSFFVSEDISQKAAREFLIHCVFPRGIQSPDDAMYSSAFAFHLHKVWTPGFSTIHYLDEMISVIAGALFGCTEAEAANLAILLWQTWRVIKKWRYEEDIFDKEVLGKPGSQIEVHEDSEETAKPISHQNFIELYNKWHSALGAALIGCLKSSEYMHMRTGLVVLSRLVEVFPTRPAIANKLLDALEPLQDESNSRPDIRASANAYGMMLVRARDEGKWVEEDEAVAKARADKEKAAAEERKKRLEQTFQEIERESEQITAELGPSQRNDRRRGGGAGGGGGDYNTPRNAAGHPSDLDNGRQSGPRPSTYAQMEVGELHLNRDRARGDDRSRRDRDRDVINDDRGGGSRGGRAADDYSRRDAGRGGGWTSSRDQPPPSRGAGNKRSRPSSPENDRDLDRSNAKRARIGGPSSPPPSRRAARRGDSPEPPPPPPPSSRSRSRRNRR